MQFSRKSLIAAILSLSLAFTPVATWALSTDELLDLMVEEKAITPEQAEKIKEKARKIDQAKKAEEEAKRARELEQVKQEAKAEAKAEAKVEAQAEAAKQVADAEQKIEKKTASWIPENLPEPLKGLSIGVLAYLDYSMGDRPVFRGPLTPTGGGAFGRNIDGHVGADQWTLTRGYLNVIKEITPWLAVRWTPDLTYDAVAGNGWVLRMKYLYGELRPPNAGNILTQIKGEIGLDHTPWHDFEETVYPYRCQGTIPIERAGVFNSADIGFNIRGNFGGELANAKELVGNEGFNGRYGTWQLGVYNGSGYTAAENHESKVPEYRVTVRPFPDFLPGFQATYFGLYGKGNSTSASNFSASFPNIPWAKYFPDWIVNMGYLSYQNPWFMLTAQMFATKGNQAGNWTTQPGGPVPIGRRADSLWTRGYSVFGDVTVPLALSIPFWPQDQQYPLHAFIRSDWFNADQDQVIATDAKFTRLITGIAYHLYKNNMILLDYERTWYGRDYGANFAGPGSIGAGGGLTWPSSLTATAANWKSNGGNLGTDQRFQMVYQLSY